MKRAFLLLLSIAVLLACETKKQPVQHKVTTGIDTALAWKMRFYQDSILALEGINSQTLFYNPITERQHKDDKQAFVNVLYNSSKIAEEKIKKHEQTQAQ